MDSFYVGQIALFAGNYAPYNFLECKGQVVSINDYQALFSLIGTSYGGDGVSNFGIPDLRGRLPIGYGQGVTDPKNGAGTALPNYALANPVGSETVTLTVEQIPPHTHTLYSCNAEATTNVPTSAMLANVSGTTTYYVNDKPGGATPTNFNLGAQSVSFQGGNQAHNNIMPVMPLMYIICVMGNYPMSS